MKRFTCLFLLLIGPALLTGLISCDKCSPSPFRYKIGGYEIGLLKNQHTTSATSPLRDNDTLAYRDLQIVLQGKVISVVLRQLGGGSSLLACSPSEDPLDKVAAITLTSDQLYSADLPAGANLAGVLGVGSASYSPTPLAGYLTTYPEARDYMLLALLKAPTQTARHRFTIVVELANGNRYSATSAPVFVRP